MHIQLSIKQFMAWLRPTEQLIQKSSLLYGNLNEAITIRDKVVKEKTRVKIICRIDEDRLGITTDLFGQSTEAIISGSQLKDICVSK